MSIKTNFKLVNNIQYYVFIALNFSQLNETF